MCVFGCFFFFCSAACVLCQNFSSNFCSVFIVVVVVVGTYFEYMAVKPLIVPSYTFFKGFAMHAIIIFLKLLIKVGSGSQNLNTRNVFLFCYFQIKLLKTNKTKKRVSSYVH